MRSLLLFTAIPLVSAHYRLLYPPWRDNSLGAESETISQWNFPCAGIEPSMSKNRTDWPLDGGSVIFNGSHPWAFTYVNLGLGSEVTSFNVSLVEGFNQTGPGVFCFPKIQMKPEYNATDGMDATIQVIQISHSGSSLYNCADIKFSKDAKPLPESQCVNGTGVGAEEIVSQSVEKSNATSSSSTVASSATGAAVHVTGGVSTGALLAMMCLGALAMGS